MSFLAPLFLLGGLAIALPVVFHLVRRSSREKQIFSSLMFLRPTLPRMTRRNRLENIFLLLLRCLAICILALGFARPFLQKPMAATPMNNASAQVVLLVDTSASMKRDGIWADALAKAESALKKTTPADQVAILTFDDQVRTVVSFEQWVAMNISERVALASQRLAESKPTWHSTHLGNALIAASDAIEDAEKREPHTGPRRIVLISDLQEGSRLEGLQGHEWPRGLEVVVEPVKAKRPTNAGLQWVADTDDSARTTDTTVRIRVHNSADAQREQFKIQWAGVADAASLDAYVPPGQSRIVPAPKLPTNTVAERITLSGDDDDFDNTAYIVQPKAEEVDVLYLGNDAESNPAQLPYYLKRAFQDTRRQAVRLTIIGGPLTPSPLPIGWGEGGRRPGKGTAFHQSPGHHPRHIVRRTHRRGSSIPHQRRHRPARDERYPDSQDPRPVDRRCRRQRRRGIGRQLRHVRPDGFHSSPVCAILRPALRRLHQDSLLETSQAVVRQISQALASSPATTTMIPPFSKFLLGAAVFLFSPFRGGRRTASWRCRPSLCRCFTRCLIKLTALAHNSRNFASATRLISRRSWQNPEVRLCPFANRMGHRPTSFPVSCASIKPTSRVFTRFSQQQHP